MIINIKVDTMKDAEKLSEVCRDYSDEITLKAGRFCVDPKSTLGILAMMYSDRDHMYIDTGDMEDAEMPKFITRIQPFVKA